MPKATVTKVDKRITVNERRFNGILNYDIDNNYPSRVRDIVANSGMGKTCVNLYKKYIFGEGFEDADFSKAALNDLGITAESLLKKFADDFGYNGGYTVHVNYNALYEISEINFQPICNVRFTTAENKKYPNMYAVYKNWCERSIDEKKIKFIYKFNPDPKAISSQVDHCGGWEYYTGQIFYYSPLENQYPLAMYDAVLEDMQTDSQAKTYKFRNITTSFLASHLLITDKYESGEADDKAGDRRAATEKENMIENLEEFQGADNVGKIMHVEKETPDQTFTLQKIDQQQGDKLYEWTENSTRDNIRQAFLQPAVLLMNTPGKLGTSKEIVDATNYYNAVTKDERQQLEETFRILMSFFHDQSLNKETNFYILPRKTVTEDDSQKKEKITKIIIDGAYTPEQKILILVSLYGVAKEDAEKLVRPVDKKQDEQTLAEKLQIGGTQSLISVITNASMTPEEKRGTLEVLFGLSPDQINLLIPEKDVANPGANPAV